MRTIPTPTLEAFCIATGVYGAEEAHSLGHTDLAHMALPFLRQHTADELRQMLNMTGDFTLESYTGCIVMRVQGSEVQLAGGLEIPSEEDQLSRVNSQSRREALQRLQEIDEALAVIHEEFVSRVQAGEDQEAVNAELSPDLTRLVTERAEVQRAALVF